MNVVYVASWLINKQLEITNLHFISFEFTAANCGVGLLGIKMRGMH